MILLLSIGAAWGEHLTWAEQGLGLGAEGYSHDVSGAGDLNGDGYADLVVGSYNNTGYYVNGSAYVYYGDVVGMDASAGEELRASTGDPFGLSVSGAGDVNADGFDDLVLGSEWGFVAVYQGGAAGIASELILEAPDEVEYGWFGWSVAGAGDLDGDGYADIALGVDHNFSLDRGVVRFRAEARASGR